MTLLLLEGYETIGDDTTATSVVKDAGELRFGISWTFSSNGPGGDLIDDFESDGAFAWRTPADSTIRTHHNHSFHSRYTSSDPLVVGFRIHFPDSFNSQQAFFSGRRSGARASLESTADCTGLVWEDKAGTVNLAGTISPNTWHYIEIEAKWLSSSSGYVKIWVDDSLIYDSGSRAISATSDLDAFRLSGINGTSNSGTDFQAFDDFYAIRLDGVRHTAKLGDIRVRRHEVTADGATINWTPSTGTDNYATIDETEVDKVDYVETSTTGDIDEYDLRNSYGSLGEADGIKIEAQGEETSSTATLLHVGLTDGTVDDRSVDLDTADTFLWHAIDVEPTSGSALTSSAVDSLRARLKWGT